MADRVVLIREGRIEQEGSPEELYARPATMFAARFIGTPGMNLLNLADGPRRRRRARLAGHAVPRPRRRAHARRAAGARLAREFRRRGRNRHELRVPWRGHDPDGAGRRGDAVHAGAGAARAGRRARRCGSPGSRSRCTCSTRRPARGRRRSCSPAASPRRPIDVSQAAGRGGSYAVRGKVRASRPTRGETPCGRYSQSSRQRSSASRRRRGPTRKSPSTTRSPSAARSPR